MTITIVLCVEGASSGTENEQHKTVKADQWQISSLFHRTTMHTSHFIICTAQSQNKCNSADVMQYSTEVTATETNTNAADITASIRAGTAGRHLLRCKSVNQDNQEL